MAQPAANVPRMVQVEDLLQDTISFERMRDAVVVPCCGNSFDMAVLQTALKVNKSCPMCRESLVNQKLIPNILLRKVANIFLEDSVPAGLFFQTLFAGNMDVLTTEQIENSISKTPVDKIQKFFRDNITEKNNTSDIESKIIEPLEGKIKETAHTKLMRAFDRACDQVAREKSEATLLRSAAELRASFEAELLEQKKNSNKQKEMDEAEKKRLRAERDSATRRADITTGGIVGVVLVGAGVLMGGGPIICATAAGDMVLGGTGGAVAGEFYNRRRLKT